MEHLFQTTVQRTMNTALGQNPQLANLTHDLSWRVRNGIPTTGVVLWNDHRLTVLEPDGTIYVYMPAMARSTRLNANEQNMLHGDRLSVFHAGERVLFGDMDPNAESIDMASINNPNRRFCTKKDGDRRRVFLVSLHLRWAFDDTMRDRRTEGALQAALNIMAAMPPDEPIS